MSVATVYAIRCDTPGCAARYIGTPARAWTHHDAEQAGWTSTPKPRGQYQRLHYCPDHGPAATLFGQAEPA